MRIRERLTLIKMWFRIKLMNDKELDSFIKRCKKIIDNKQFDL